MTEQTKAALRVVKSLGMVPTRHNIIEVEHAIEAETQLSGGTFEEAANAIRQAAVRDREQGATIDRFYFEDGRWRNKRNPAKVVQFPKRDTTERKSASENPMEEGSPDLRVRGCPSCRRGDLWFCQRRDGAFFIKCSNPRCIRKESVPTNSTEIQHVRAEYEVATKCGICGAAMIEKMGQRGPFLGCGAWPLCNFSLPLPANLGVQ